MSLRLIFDVIFLSWRVWPTVRTAPKRTLSLYFTVKRYKIEKHWVLHTGCVIFVCNVDTHITFCILCDMIRTYKTLQALWLFLQKFYVLKEIEISSNLWYCLCSYEMNQKTLMRMDQMWWALQTTQVMWKEWYWNCIENESVAYLSPSMCTFLSFLINFECWEVVKDLEILDFWS